MAVLIGYVVLVLHEARYHEWMATGLQLPADRVVEHLKEPLPSRRSRLRRDR